MKPQYFGFMGKAISEAMAEMLQDDWTTEYKESWDEVFEELSGVIMRSMLNSNSK